MPAGPIPVNLVTGFLGVGKTTAIVDLLKRKNPAEKWAVLVNEYGEVSVDEAFLESNAPESGVSIRSVAGGCFCCTTAPMLPVALHFMLQDSKLDRLLIETSGMGHPARLLDTIRANYAGRLELRATLGIVTPSDFSAPGMIDSNPVFRDQIEMSDVLVLNKAETAKAGVIEEFQTWANGLFPPKLLIAATSEGRLEPEWLDLSSDDERRPLFPEAHADPVEMLSLQQPKARPGKPRRFPSPGACGWVFDLEEVFDEERLLMFFNAHPELTRFKGLFRLEESWRAYNRAGGMLRTTTSAYRRDSRIEAFGEANWGEIEAGLLGCRI